MLRRTLLTLALLLVAVPALAHEDGIHAVRLQCEYVVDPVGIDVAAPRLAWSFEEPYSQQRGQRQTAYQILVASTPEKLADDQGDVWDSGRVFTDQSTHVVYEGKKLQSCQQCYWKVRIWDKEEEESEWSAPASWSMGILAPADWKASWIGYTKPYDPPRDDTAQKGPSPLFRKSFQLDRPVRSATISIAGLGFYELRLNGAKVGNRVLDPAFTRYDRRVLYTTYDVTERLRTGANAIGVMLGNGWYNVHTRAVWDFDQAPWRAEPCLLAQLHVVYADGATQTIATDATWRASTGPITHDSIRNGETYDARLEKDGWDLPEYDDAAWEAPQVVDGPKGVLRAAMLPPARVTQTIDPKVTEPKPGVYVFDTGQNMAGWARLDVSGPAGTKITLRYAERLQPDGTITQKTIDKFVKQGPFQTDVYILKGKGRETWQPRFTYHGFQYVEVTGLPEKPTADTLKACVVQTDFPLAGEFRCSDKLLSRIQHDTLWSYRSNFADGYPTDCPQREKNGWTGDAHLAAEQAQYNFQNTPGYLKWLGDLQDEQQPDGSLPGIVPTGGWGYKWGNGPAWDSAYVLIPWYLYLYQGDTRVLEEHYDGMKRYVDYMTSRAKDNLVDFGLGDWVPAKTKTPVPVTSTGYYFVDTKIVARAAEILGHKEDAKRYADLAAAIRDSYNKAFYKGDGLYANGSQTALSCAIYQGFVTDEERPKVVARLADAVKTADDHLDVGILGAKYLFHALSDNGRHELAYTIATQTTAPSYGDWIRRGATTLWEDWGDGASRNHVMFGDISAWFYQELAGIHVDPDSPGFKHILIRPRPVAGLKEVKCSHETPFGPVRVAWRAEEKWFRLNLVVPINTTATVYVPAPSADAVTEDGRKATDSPGVRFVEMQDGRALFEVPAGRYQFEVRD